MSEHSIVIDNLSLGYKISARKKKEIFPAFSLVAESTESVALIGRNGVGKSTLLRTLAGLQPIFKGDICIDNKKVKQITQKDYAKLVSFVSTAVVNVMHLRVFDLLSLGRYAYTNWLGVLSKADELVVFEALDMVGMSSFVWRNISELSDGERQRVMIARALVQDTPIVILDEPTAFLDIPNKYEIMLLLKKLAKEKSKTIIFSTHDLNIAMQLADKIWLMANNNMYVDSPQNIVAIKALDQMVEGTNLRVENGELRIIQ